MNNTTKLLNIVYDMIVGTIVCMFLSLILSLVSFGLLTGTPLAVMAGLVYAVILNVTPSVWLAYCLLRFVVIKKVTEIGSSLVNFVRPRDKRFTEVTFLGKS